MKIVTIIIFTILIGSGAFFSALPAAAEEGKLLLRTSATIREVLTERMGKRVTLRLQAGEELEGNIIQVGDSLVHLTNLAGKDFYDAVIGIDRINAVLIRVRGR
jgi:hypothetical protein